MILQCRIILKLFFGEENFRNEIVWKRTTSAAKGSQFAAKSWGANTDIIFYYTKTDDFKLSPLEKIDSQKYTKEIEKLFPKIDSKGERYNIFVPLYCSKSMGASFSISLNSGVFFIFFDRLCRGLRFDKN